SLASSSFVRIGDEHTTCRHVVGRGDNKLSCGPSVEFNDVTSASKLASSGGVFTRANNCLKDSYNIPGRLEVNGGGVSVPIEPSDSTALRAIGAMIRRRSSWV